MPLILAGRLCAFLGLLMDVIGDNVRPLQTINANLHIMIFPRGFRSLCLLSIVPLVAFAQSTGNGRPEPGILSASRVMTPPEIDGHLNDDVWRLAVPISSFIQRELHEGAPATERTEVRIVYDSRALYIGVCCYDSDPQGIVANQLKRDFDYTTDDDFELVLDTYHDGRNG
ncbi:hypothetical protein EHM92_07325, partial [bacterium]